MVNIGKIEERILGLKKELADIPLIHYELSEGKKGSNLSLILPR
jgi:hypothetical protein